MVDCCLFMGLVNNNKQINNQEYHQSYPLPYLYLTLLSKSIPSHV